MSVGDTSEASDDALLAVGAGAAPTFFGDDEKSPKNDFFGGDATLSASSLTELWG